MIVAEAFGRGLVVEPYFATVVLAGGLLPGGLPMQRLPPLSCHRSPR